MKSETGMVETSAEEPVDVLFPGEDSVVFPVGQPEASARPRRLARGSVVPEDSSCSGIDIDATVDDLDVDYEAKLGTLRGSNSDYLVLGRLAGGGMADIYLGHAHNSRGFEGRVAIKIPRAQLVAEFADEGRLAEKLVHPNIVRVLDTCADPGSPFMVMEYLDGLNGLTLSDLCDRRVPLDIVLAIGIRVGLALEYVHHATWQGQPMGIVHRDVSPANIVICHTGEVKLIDFGVAMFQQRTESTRAGIVKGKVAYMSPEQSRGEPVDMRSDIYSLGVTLYELMTGTLPYSCGRGAGDAALLNHVGRGRITPPKAMVGEFPGELENVLLGMLAAKPSDRVQSARAAVLALQAFEQGSGLRASSQEIAEFLGKLARPTETRGLEETVETAVWTDERQFAQNK